MLRERKVAKHSAKGLQEFHMKLTLWIYFFADIIFYSESSDVAVDIFNKQGLLPYLVASLKTEIYPTSVAIPAGQLLYCYYYVCTDLCCAAVNSKSPESDLSQNCHFYIKKS